MKIKILLLLMVFAAPCFAADLAGPKYNGNDSQVNIGTTLSGTGMALLTGGTTSFAAGVLYGLDMAMIAGTANFIMSGGTMVMTTTQNATYGRNLAPNKYPAVSIVITGGTMQIIPFRAP